jgi:hypothetical protein
MDTPLLCKLAAQRNAFLRFFIQQLRRWRAAALVANAKHCQGARDYPLAQRDCVPGFDFARGFHIKLVDGNPAFFNFFGSQGSGFVKARGPEPFVDTEFFHWNVF